jgi:PatG C-terminal
MNVNDQILSVSRESHDMSLSTASKIEPVPQESGDPSCDCNTENQTPMEQLIYSIGKLDVRFPSIGIEREFQQRERHLALGQQEQWTNRGERLSAVLRSTSHLSRSVCLIHLIGGIPAYAIVPTSQEILSSVIEALQYVDLDDAWTLVIGRSGPMAKPTTCGGLLVQMVGCDAFYSFTLSEFVRELSTKVEPALSRENINTEQFTNIARELFLRITLSLENMGGLDQHRALNYMLVQHPGPFIAVAQRANTAVLNSIETRLNITPGARRIVTVIFTFIDRATGVPERLFTRIDVTEEWPFVADSLHAGSPPLGLSPFVDGGGIGSSI